VPDVDAQETRYALQIPHGLSLMAFDDWNATVRGLDAFPRDEWPPVDKVHFSFQVMVATGSLMAALAVWTLLDWLRRRREPSRWQLWSYALSGPMGLIALESGWLVTEYGRQPWVVRGALRTADAVTGFKPLAPSFFLFSAVYLGLTFVVLFLLGRQIAGTLPREPVVPTAGASHADY
jgi:cytochrome d ubiquinol oxidase subunit I